MAVEIFVRADIAPQKTFILASCSATGKEISVNGPGRRLGVFGLRGRNASRISFTQTTSAEKFPRSRTTISTWRSARKIDIANSPD